MDEVRYWMVKETASKPLDRARGSKFAYSNLGHTIAGAILERTGGKTWEELVNERIIGPLDLRSAGFAPQTSLGKVDAPLGNLLVDGKPKAMLAGPNEDHPLVIGPAGTMHTVQWLVLYRIRQSMPLRSFASFRSSLGIRAA